jgi:hypothetical protein
MMKKAVFKLGVILSVVLLFSNCTFTKGITPSKTYITRNYNVGTFTAINFSGVGNIVFTQTPGKSGISVYGPENYVQHVTVTIENNVLKIGMDDSKSGRFSYAERLKININAPLLTNIFLKGVGNITINKLNIDNLEVVNKGVGNIKIDSISGKSLNVTSNGVGNVTLGGSVHASSLSCNGVGNIDAVSLKSKIVEANCRGVGSINCFATDSITATVKGVGSIRYKGQPVQKDFDKSGIGSIKEY